MGYYTEQEARAEAERDSKAEWHGEGVYTISFNGQKDDSLYRTRKDLEDDLYALNLAASEFNLPSCDWVPMPNEVWGSKEDCLHSIQDTLGEFARDYDIEGIMKQLFTYVPAIGGFVRSMALADLGAEKQDLADEFWDAAADNDISAAAEPIGDDGPMARADERADEER